MFYAEQHLGLEFIQLCLSSAGVYAYNAYFQNVTVLRQVQEPAMFWSIGTPAWTLLQSGEQMFSALQGNSFGPGITASNAQMASSTACLHPPKNHASLTCVSPADKYGTGCLVDYSQRAGSASAGLLWGGPALSCSS